VTAAALESGLEALVGQATVGGDAPTPAPAPVTIAGFPLIPVIAGCAAVALAALALVARKRAGQGSSNQRGGGGFAAGAAATNPSLADIYGGEDLTLSGGGEQVTQANVI
jgi:hypothetical protein